MQQLLMPASILPQNIMLEITNQIDKSIKHKPVTVPKKSLIKSFIKLHINIEININYSNIGLIK